MSNNIVHLIDDDADVRRALAFLLGTSGLTVRIYESASEFLDQDLKRNVSASGRPVIAFHHFGFDKEHSLQWWPEEWRTAYFNQIKSYNIIAILHGHSHKTAIYQWNGIDIYHPPHLRGDPKKGELVTHGFFVFHITDDELTVAERKLDDTWGLTSRKSLRKP